MMIMIMKRAEQRDDARHRPELGADQFAERAPVAAHGDEQDHEVLHAPASTTPARITAAGQIAHLRREHRPDERPRAGDGREAAAVEHVFVGGDVIEPSLWDGGGRPRWVELLHVPGDERE